MSDNHEIEEIKKFISKPGTAKGLVIANSDEAARVLGQLKKYSNADQTFSVQQLKDFNVLNELNLTQYKSSVTILFNFEGQVKGTIEAGLSNAQINDKVDELMANI